jgi:hypothetical protein
MYGFSAYAGLGLDVPMMKFGTTPAVGHPVADSSGTCSDSFAVQQMLNDLGFGPLVVDGQIGNATFAALKKFAQSTGTSYGGAFPQASLCQALMDAWQAQKGSVAPAAPTPAPVSRPASVFLNPAILASIAQKPAAVPSVSPISSPGWWSGQSTTMKAVVIVGGIAVLGTVVYLATKKRQAKANARRRRLRARRNHGPYSVHERAGKSGFGAALRGVYESPRSAYEDAKRAQKLGESVVIRDGHSTVIYDSRW